MSIGQNMKRLRIENGLTQEELANVAGVGISAVSAWENDVKIPRMPTLQRIADYFGVEKSDIIEDEKLSTEEFRLTMQEKEIIKIFRATNERGRLEIISAIVTIGNKNKK